MLSEDSKQVEINVDDNTLVETVILTPAFTSTKKLPYEYGKVTITGG